MRRRFWFLPLAAALFLAAAYLMSRGDAEERPAVVRLEFPSRMRAPERERMATRRTLELPPPPLPEGQPRTFVPNPARDPVLTAIGGGGESGTALVLEANALRYSPVGELLMECLKGKRAQARLDQLKDATGVNPLEAVDRVALGDDVVMISGHFGEARWDSLLQTMKGSAHGDKGMVYLENPAAAEGGDAQPRRRGPGLEALGTWGGQLLLLGPTEKVKAALDRLEGRGPPTRPLLSEEQTYGEMYGVLSPESVGQLLGEDQQELAKRFKDAASRVELHLDAARDVAMVAEVRGPDGEQVQDLGKTLGAALSLGRLKAQTSGEKDVAELMDLARVVRRGHDDGSFRLELALPLELIQKRLAFCKDRNREGREPE